MSKGCLKSQNIEVIQIILFPCF